MYVCIYPLRASPSTLFIDIIYKYIITNHFKILINFIFVNLHILLIFTVSISKK